MDPLKRYTGNKETDRTYDAVQLFLSQLSRYLRLATHIDMDKDISEYVASSLDGFAYKWFEALDKGTEPFAWVKFEKVFRRKFIPREHIENAIDRYMDIKQKGRPVIEYIAEKEELENTLGEIIPKELKETSFRKGLDAWIRDKLIIFRGLPLKEYREKAESIDMDARERKIGPYKVKSNPEKDEEKKPNDKAGSGSGKGSMQKPSTSTSD